MKEWRQMPIPEKPLEYKLEDVAERLRPVVRYFEEAIKDREDVLEESGALAKKQAPGGDAWNRGMQEVFAAGKEFRECRAILRALVRGETTGAAAFLRGEITRVEATLAQLEEDAAKFPEQFRFDEMITNTSAEIEQLEALLAACEVQ